MGGGGWALLRRRINAVAITTTIITSSIGSMNVETGSGKAIVVTAVAVWVVDCVSVVRAVRVVVAVVVDVAMVVCVVVVERVWVVVVGIVV